MEFLKKNIGAIVLILVILLLIIFAILVGGKNDVKPVEIDETLLSEDVRNWINDTKKDEYFITVLGGSTCPYCADYKPIIEQYVDDENLNFKWFYIDTVTNENAEDGKALENTYKLENYDGHIPYTFVTKNGEFVTDVTGYMEKDELISFLKSANVVK